MAARVPVGRTVVFGGGIALCLAYLIALVAGWWTLEMLLYAAPAPLFLGGALVYAGHWMQDDSVVERYHRRTAAWFLLGIGLLGTAGWLTLSYQASRGVFLVDRAYLVANWATGGGFLGLVIGVYDSQRRRRERRLAEERATTHELNQRLSVLNRILRHDLRNGLNIVQGYANRLRDGLSDPEEAVDVITDATGDLLEVSEKARRMQSVLHTQGTVPDEVDIVPAVERLVASAEADYPDAEIRLEAPDSAPITGGGLIEFAVECVLENAIEHNDRAAPEVHVSVAVDERTTVRVADDGPGIPDEDRDVMARDLETPLDHSSGFGLWLARWIVEEADGTIRIDDRAPRGTVVTLELPGP